MFTKKSKKKLLITMYANLTIGLLLAGIGIVLEISNSSIVENVKAFVGLSFIPLALGFYSLFTLIMVKKNPEKMKSLIISENDERLVAAKNEADAIAFQILQWAIMLVFFGYTTFVPEDIFETPAYWIVFAFFFATYLLQGVLESIYLRKDKKISFED